MELQYFGGNCIKITTKKAGIVIDDDLAKIGKKAVLKDTDTALYTSSENVPNVKAHLIISQPGEYEVSDVSIIGIPANNFRNPEGKPVNTIYKIEAEDVTVAVLGDVSPKLSPSQIESLGRVNVLVIPVGGNDYTLNGTDALKIIKDIEPDFIIPTHYKDQDVSYEKPQLSLEEAINQLAMEPTERLAKFKLKPGLTSEAESTKLVVLEKS